MDFIHKFVPAKNAIQDNTTLVLLHGTGGNEEDLISLGQFIAPDAALLGVRGKVLEANAPRFFRRLSEGVFDEQDLIFRTHELARFIEQATAAYSLPANKFIAVGYSNGANIAASLLLLEPNVLESAILLRAMVPLIPEILPKLQGKQLLIEAGRLDPIVPAAQSERLAGLLRRAGAEVSLQWQNAGHGLIQSELESAREWMKARR